MAIPANSIHYVFRGNLPGGERWASGIWQRPNQPGNDAQLIVDQFCTGGAFTAFAGAITACLTANATLAAVDAYLYGQGGTAATSKGTHNLNTVGTGAGRLPNQCAIVLTLNTAQVGRSGRGRMYIPAVGVTMTANGTADSSFIDPLRTTLATLAGADALGVVSSTQTAFRALTAVTTDTVLDTIRARSEKVATARTRTAV